VSGCFITGLGLSRFVVFFTVFCDMVFLLVTRGLRRMKIIRAASPVQHRRCPAKRNRPLTLLRAGLPLPPGVCWKSGQTCQGIYSRGADYELRQ
jgi:hypothetical protein